MFDIKDFGIKCFSEKEIKNRIPINIYEKYKKTLLNKDNLDEDSASIIAKAMKDWALNLGATHYCHWFQPLSSITAEKHDAFLTNDNGTPIMSLSGKSLIKGEPDASSFPHGGLRTIFEARGYSYWDCSSPSFIKDNILYIPSIFVSYHGDSLDYKLPLLKSINYLSIQAKKVLSFFNQKAEKIIPMIGLEQEFFLIDSSDYLKRRDLLLCDKTLIGDLPPKSQETYEHYLGAIPIRVQKYLNDVNDELWKLGIYAKTEHNEVAPCQFEICPIYNEMNIAVDQNLLIMNTLKKTAKKHGLVCLLHEKPFFGINGSGKHNNYSLIINNNDNLFDPGETPTENIRFLLFVCAFIKGIDEYAPLIRVASSNEGNNYRLGANEAPPGIISIYLGDEIEKVLNNLIEDNEEINKKYELDKFDYSTFAYLPKDNSDRNRTSPIAFTGNKFEFRMLGSSMNPSFLNTIINIILGSSLEEIANELYKNKDKNIEEQMIEICKSIIKEHKKVLYSGNGYSDEWKKEANQRGLPNIKSFYESISYLLDKKSINLLTKNKIFTLETLKARSNILFEQNNNLIHIKARTLAKIIEQNIIPALTKEINYLVNIKTSSYISKKIILFSNIIDSLHEKVEQLKQELTIYLKQKEIKEKAKYLHNKIIPLMENIRTETNNYEKIASQEIYPFPTYEKILNSIY